MHFARVGHIHHAVSTGQKHQDRHQRRGAGQRQKERDDLSADQKRLMA
jgi:hypothetical protein